MASVLLICFLSGVSVFDLICKSLTHVELIFIQDEIWESSFSVLQVDVQFSQHHLLEAVFSPMYIFVQDQMVVVISVTCSVSYCTDLCLFLHLYHAIFVTKPLQYIFEIEYCDVSRLALFAYILAILSLLCFHVNFKFLSSFVKNIIDIFDRNFIESYLCLSFMIYSILWQVRYQTFECAKHAANRAHQEIGESRTLQNLCYSEK